MEGEPEHFRKLFIGGLSYDTTEDSLKNHFEKYGEVVDVVVMRDPNTKRSRGFGFVTFEKSSQLDAAQAARPHIIDNREVEPKRAVPRDRGSAQGGGGGGGGGSRNHVKKVFVGGIKENIDEEELRNYFQQYGSVETVDVIRDRETQKKRGFAFVGFSDYDPVDKIVLIRHHDICGVQCEVKKAQSRQDILSSGGRGGGGGRGGYGGGGGGYGGGGGSYGGGGGYGGGSSYSNGNGYSGGGGGGGGYGGGSSYSSGGGYGGGGGSGGYGGGSYGSTGGYGGNSGWEQGQTGYGATSTGGSWNNLGSNYGSSYSGGPQRNTGSYQSKGSGPYGGGYGSSGDSYSSQGYGGGGGGYNRR
ncbi:Heterogeneous nuclear ribonucleoprotein A3 [Lamellibrachia satsuma]|nr:Heterogeneous nuclear ribonucleoprotein A3 [Lamellibrachia satsuma]